MGEIPWLGDMEDSLLDNTWPWAKVIDFTVRAKFKNYKKFWNFDQNTAETSVQVYVKRTTTNQYYPTFFNLEVVLNRSFKDVLLFLLDSYNSVLKNWNEFFSSE